MNKRKKTFFLSIIVMFIMLMIPVKSMASDFMMPYMTNRVPGTGYL